MPEYVVGIRIKATSEDAALASVKDKLGDVRGELAKTEKASKETTSEVDKLKGAFKDMIVQLGLMAVAAKGLQYFKDGLASSMEEASLLLQTSENMRALTGATDEQVASLDAWTTAVQMSSGVLQDDLYPAVVKVGAAVKDFETSQTLVEIAAGAAARGIGTFEGNVDGLIRVVDGKAIRATDAFSSQLKELAEDGKLNEEQFALLVESYGDAGAEVDTLAMRMKRAETGWDEAKESIGGLSTGIYTILAPAMKVAATIIGMVTAGVIKLAGYFVVAGKASQAWSAMLRQLATGDIAGAKAVWATAMDSMAKTTEEFSARADAAMEGVVSAFEQPVIQAKKSKTQLAAELKAMQKSIDENAKGTEKAEKAKTKSVQDGEKDRRAAEEKANKERIKSEQDANKKRLKQTEKLYDDMADIQKKMDRDRADSAREEAEAYQAEQERKQAAQEKYTAAGLALASAAFGDAKELQYAEAIASTYFSAQKAYESQFLPVAEYTSPIRGAIAAAMAVAMGMANVARIASAAGGYDIPSGVNPLVQAHAEEMVLPAKLSNAFRAIADRPMMSHHSSVVNQNAPASQITVNQSLLTGAHATYAYKELERGLRPARRTNERMYATSPTVRIGSKRKVDRGSYY